MSDRIRVKADDAVTPMLERLSTCLLFSSNGRSSILLFEKFIPAIVCKEHGIEERTGYIREACLGLLAQYKPNIIHLVHGVLDTLPRGQGERQRPCRKEAG